MILGLLEILIHLTKYFGCIKTLTMTNTQEVWVNCIFFRVHMNDDKFLVKKGNDMCVSKAIIIFTVVAVVVKWEMLYESENLNLRLLVSRSCWNLDTSLTFLEPQFLQL